MKDYARLNAQGMASLLSYLAWETSATAELLADVCGLIRGWAPRYEVINVLKQSFEEACAEYKDDPKAWDKVTARAWALAQKFQGLGAMESPICQLPGLDGNICGKATTSDGHCFEQASHVAAC